MGRFPPNLARRRLEERSPAKILLRRRLCLFSISVPAPATYQCSWIITNRHPKRRDFLKHISRLPEEAEQQSFSPCLRYGALDHTNPCFGVPSPGDQHHTFGLDGFISLPVRSCAADLGAAARLLPNFKKCSAYCLVIQLGERVLRHFAGPLSWALSASPLDCGPSNGNIVRKFLIHHDSRRFAGVSPHGLDRFPRGCGR